MGHYKFAHTLLTQYRKFMIMQPFFQEKKDALILSFKNNGQYILL